MPPRRRAAPANAAAPAAAPCAPIPPTFEDASIANLLCEVEHNLDVIRKHKVFKDIMVAEPLSVNEGGLQAPFDQDSFKKVLESGGNYTCGINFMWIGHKLRAMTGVPISHRAIDVFLTKDRFDRHKFSSVLDIAVDSVTYKPLEHKGALLRMSAPEESFAFILQIKKDIENDARPEDLKKWRTCLLSVTARFMVVESAEDRWWHEYNSREEVNMFSDAICQTAYQRFCGISRLLDVESSVNGASSPAKVAQMFAEKARDGSNNGDQITESYIKEVMLVREHVLSNKKVCAIVQALDEKYGHNSVFNSMYKLSAVKRQAKTSAMIEWVFDGIYDSIESECCWLTDAPPSVRDFTKSVSKAIVGVFVHKKQFLDYMLRQMDALFPTPIALKLQETFADYTSFRAVRPFVKKGLPQPELTFMAEWTTAARMTFTFIADTCFLCDHPYVYPFQQSWRAGRAVTAVLDYSAVQEQWSKITKLVKDAKQDEKVLGEVGTVIGSGLDPATGKDGEAVVVDGEEVGSTVESEKGETTAPRNVFWKKFAEETVRSCISLRPVPSTEVELIELVKTCDASKVKVVHGLSTVIKFYDEKMAGEALSMPNVRKPPHRTNYFKSCIAAGMDAGGNGGKCGPGELYIVLDHGKNSIQSAVNKSFHALAGHCQVYDILVDEDSLVLRRGRKTKNVLKQSERMFVFVCDPQAIPDEKRKYYKGTSKGQSWGFITLTPFSHVWRIPAEQKKLAYGEALRPVGGKASAEEAADSGGDEELVGEDPGDTRGPVQDVPFCYYGLPLMFVKDLLHVSHTKAVIDFTPGEGNFALAVTECKGAVLYFGLCHTELHCQLLRDYLTDCVLAAMQKEGNPLFNELCAAEFEAGQGHRKENRRGGKNKKATMITKRGRSPRAMTRKQRRRRRGQNRRRRPSPNDSPEENESDD